MIKVYEREGCAQCVRTKRFLDARDVEYETHQLTEGNVGTFKALGITQAPIVAYSHEGMIFAFGGFSPERLAEAINIQNESN